MALCVAFALRAPAAMLLGHGGPLTVWGIQHGDVYRYLTQAESFLDGAPSLDLGGYPSRHGSVYPLFLTLVFGLFGQGQYAVVRLLQVAMSLASCWLLYRTAARIFGDEAARYVFGLSLVWFGWFYWSAELLTECLFTLMLVLALYLLARAQGSLWWLLAAAVAMALAAQTRITMLALVPFLLVWVFMSQLRRGWTIGALSVGLVLAAFLLCYMPLDSAFRDRERIDPYMRPEIMAKVYTGSYRPLVEAPPAPEGLSRLQREAYYGGLLLDEMRSRRYWRHLLLTKVLGFWYPLYNVNNGAFFIFEYSLVFAAPFFLFGVWRAPRSSGYWLLLCPFLAAYAIIVAFLYGDPRHRCPADPAIIAFAGYGLREYVRLHFAHRARRYLLWAYGSASLACVAFAGRIYQLLQQLLGPMP